MTRTYYVDRLATTYLNATLSGKPGYEYIATRTGDDIHKSKMHIELVKTVMVSQDLEIDTDDYINKLGDIMKRSAWRLMNQIEQAS